MNRSRRKTRVVGCLHGFTLIELLVAVSIIALLVGLLLPVLGASRSTAQGMTCLSNLRQLTAAVLNYVNDADDWVPYEYVGSAPFPAGELSTATWWDRVGQVEGDPNPVKTAGYIPYNPKLYRGAVWHCPLAVGQITNPWLNTDRFSAHYGLNSFVYGRRKSDGTFNTLSTNPDGFRVPRRLSMLRPDVVLLGDADELNFGSLRYFQAGLNYIATGNERPWPIATPGSAITLHNTTVNLSNTDGSATALGQRWDTTAMARRFKP